MGTHEVNLATEATIVSRLLAEYGDLSDPRHAAAVCYLTTRPVFYGLLADHKPAMRKGRPHRNGCYVTFDYEGWELSATPQPQYVLQTADRLDSICLIDLVYPLPYYVSSWTYNPRTHQSIEHPSSFHYVPLLIQVRLDPISILPDIMAFNVIRHFISGGTAGGTADHELRENECILATRRPLTEPETKLLAGAHIHHYQLDEKFDSFSSDLLSDLVGEDNRSETTTNHCRGDAG